MLAALKPLERQVARVPSVALQEIKQPSLLVAVVEWPWVQQAEKICWTCGIEAAAMKQALRGELISTVSPQAGDDILFVCEM
jgi:hypothetical protein